MKLSCLYLYKHFVLLFETFVTLLLFQTKASCLSFDSATSFLQFELHECAHSLSKSIFLPRGIARALSNVSGGAMKSSHRDLDHAEELLSRITEAE